jgi:hypothetical protein
VISAHARHATSAEAGHVTSAKATNMTSAKATNVTSAEATHGTCAEAATAPVSSAASAAATTATASLRTRRKQGPGQQGGRQYHHCSSSSHDIFLSMARAISEHFSPRPHMVARLPIANGKFRRH